MILRISSFCLVGALVLTLPALSTGHPGWTFLSGIFVSLAFVPVARYGPRSFAGLFGAIALVMIVIGLVCMLSEGRLFFPEMKIDWRAALVGGSVVYLIVAAVMAAAAKLLKLSASGGQKPALRPAPLLVPLTLLGGLSYVLYYLIFGAIVFQFFTRQYYPHAVEQVMAMGNWFWAYQFGRGLLMTLAVLPVIFTLRLPRWQVMLATGALVWLAGGGASLLVPNSYMVAAQRYTHIIEIMTQNVCLGMTAAWLLRSKTVTKLTPVAVTQ